MGQHMTRIGKRLPQRKRTLPRAELPRLSVAMYMLQGQRRPTYNRGQPPPERIKRKARELLTSEAGLKHRGRRCIEPEAVFGIMKSELLYAENFESSEAFMKALDEYLDY